MKRNIFDENSSREIKAIDNVFGNFLIDKGLYDEIEITEDNIMQLADLVGGHVKIDIYCPECKDSRVFSCEAIPYFFNESYQNGIEKRLLERELISWQEVQKMTSVRPDNSSKEPWSWTNQSIIDDTRIMVFKFTCAMDSQHHLDYIVLTQGNKMIKIGQYPSVADLSFPELKEYKKVMQKEDEKELKRAIGLFASGIGVGSFVYLRRIFERIIVNASKMAIQKGKITEEDLAKCRVDEKIKKLSDYLPKSLIGNTVFYGIISKGIHELTEEECLEYFPVMKGFIMLILRQWEQMRRDEEEEKAIQASLSKIAGKITNT